MTVGHKVEAILNGPYHMDHIILTISYGPYESYDIDNITWTISYGPEKVGTGTYLSKDEPFGAVQAKEKSGIFGPTRSEFSRIRQPVDP